MNDPELQQLRQHKDEMFRRDHHSPIPAEQRSSFSGLRYLLPAPDLAFDLPVEPDAFSCLLPPPEDWLRVPMGAGEAAYAR